MLDPSSSVTCLDRSYQTIVDTAFSLARRYFELAQGVQAESNHPHVPALIDIRQISPNAWAFYWIRAYPPKNTSKEKRRIETLLKGHGHKYPTGTFSFVPSSLKPLVRDFEKQLAELRELASDNRALRKTLLAWDKRYQKIIRQKPLEPHC